MNDQRRLYTVSFIQVIVGAMLTMTGVSLQFHFGEYVASLGYGVDVLGWIVGVGMVGSLALRPYSGTWIDRLGCRPCFMLSAVGAAAANYSFQFLESQWAICLARIIMQASNATFLAAVAVYAAQVAPPVRRAESLGTVGIGGFLGMMTGPAIGDVIFESLTGRQSFAMFFNLVAATSLLAGVVVATVPSPVRGRHDFPPLASMLRRYWPGQMLIPPVVFALMLTIHMNFLERYAEHRGFVNIRWFFLAYAPTAITLRIIARQAPQRFGRHRICGAGLCAMGVGMLLFIWTRAQWHLVFPALLMGAGHCFVFPSMVDLVAEFMPNEHRGMGTSLALGGMDVGFLLGGILWGHWIDWFGFSVTFATSAAVTLTTAVFFLGSPAREPPAHEPP